MLFCSINPNLYIFKQPIFIAIIIYFTTIHFRKPYLSVLFGVKFNKKDSIKSYIGYKMNITVNVTTNAKTLLTYNQKCLL